MWGFQGLRSPKKRSLLGVNEHFESKRNTEITHYFGPFQVKAYNVGISRLAKSEKPQHTMRM